MMVLLLHGIVLRGNVSIPTFNASKVKSNLFNSKMRPLYQKCIYTFFLVSKDVIVGVAMDEAHRSMFSRSGKQQNFVSFV